MGEAGLTSEEGVSVPDASFKGLELYEGLSPVVADTLKFVESFRDFDTKHDYVFEELRTELVELMPTLADGYNRYHSGDKADAYRKVRSSISRVQALLFLLNDLDFTKNEKSHRLAGRFENHISHVNGLIRKMEEDGRAHEQEAEGGAA